MNFRERCEIAEQCVPSGLYRDRLRDLHGEMLDEIDRLRGTLRALLDRNITFLDQDAIFPFESHTQAFNHITEARDLAFRNYQERDMTTHIATGIADEVKK